MAKAKTWLVKETISKGSDEWSKTGNRSEGFSPVVFR